MNKADIEIPLARERGKRYRFFEILPGALTWTILAFPFVMSQFNPRLTAFIIIMYLLLWFTKSVGLLVRNIQGVRIMNQHQKLNWPNMLGELITGYDGPPEQNIPKWHYEHIKRYQQREDAIHPEEIIHAIIIATYNESRATLEPTIQSVIASHYDMNKVILVLAYEERGGEAVEQQAKQLMIDYQATFRYAFAVKHPKDMRDEVIGKGGNITYAARQLAKYLAKKQIDPMNVIVTTLDSDNRPHPNYLAALSYIYAVCPDPLHASFQPIPMFTNNIWDAPAPMRVIATGNSFWNIILSLRPHILRNFSSHSQGMAALIETDFWSVRTIVEDGHQYWRTYFRFDGKHIVYPVFLPIYQDAVLAGTFLKTLRMQFIQLRRWAWGASDIAYVAEKGFFTKNKVSRIDLIMKFLRLLEGHISWSTAPLILAFAAFIPLLFNPNDISANKLPIIASAIQRIAMVGIIATMFMSLKLLPPKPKRYKAHRSLFMVLQWIYLPVTTILYNSLAAINAQTRLMLGLYLGKFDVTEKAVINEDKEKVVGA